MTSKKITLLFVAVIPAIFSCGCSNKDVNPTYVEIMSNNVKAYVDAMYTQDANIDESLKYKINNLGGDTVKIEDYASHDKCDNFHGVQITLEIDKNFDGTKMFHVATKEDFSDEIIYQTKDKNVKIGSLLANTKYYWKTTNVSNENSSEVKTFTTSKGWRAIDSGAASNVRDIGGRDVKNNKRIKQGYIYRGCEINAAPYIDGNQGEHYQTLNNQTAFAFKNIMKVGTEIDFRSLAETNGQTSSNLGWSVNYLRKSINGYDGTINNKSGSEYSLLKDIFEEFIKAETDNSVYFHCWGGADRTGTVAFLLGGMLGMSYLDLIIDFELTSFSYNFRTHSKVDPDNHNYFPNLITALKEITGNSQVENPDIQDMCVKFLTEKVGLTNQQITSLQNKLLEDR